jgi:hypothetical protein
MLTYLNLSSDNFLEIDVNVETLLKVRLDGDITTTKHIGKVEYAASGVRITVITTPLEWMLEIHTDTIRFKDSYCDYPELPEVLAEIIAKYREARANASQ